MDLLTYEQAMAEVKTFIVSRGRFRMEGASWGRWLAEAKLLPRVRTAMVGMNVGHPWLEVQRQDDRERVSVEKVSEEPPK